MTEAVLTWLRLLDGVDVGVPARRGENVGGATSRVCPPPRFPSEKQGETSLSLGFLGFQGLSRLYRGIQRAAGVGVWWP